MARLLMLLLLATVQPAWAHFSEGTKIREIVVAEGSGETLIYIRTPAPLVFADAIEKAAAAQAPLTNPFLYLEQTDAGPRYRIDTNRIAQDPEAFASRLQGALRVARDGEARAPTLIAFRLSPRRPNGPFDTAGAARAALAKPTTGLDPVFGDAIVEYALRLPPGDGALSVQSALPAIALPEGTSIDNHITRDSGQQRVTITEPGQLAQPKEVPQSGGSALASFAKHGITHIVTGYDHVFLVICFALGIGWSRQLFWVVTAFTLGHSVTLVMGAAGLVPPLRWFIPAIEAAIALSVVFAALAAWQRRIAWKGGAAPALMAIGIGLIHGFGFASFLSESLSPGAPAFVSALAGFNIGLELGQLALVAATLAGFGLLNGISTRIAGLSRGAILAGIALVSAYWSVERIVALGTV